jgi:cytosine/uracil/thiamine/allantoin permease
VDAPGPLDALYSYAWFVTFALSFVLYLLFSYLVPAGPGRSEDETSGAGAQPCHAS